jgi:hypothetical protein
MSRRWAAAILALVFAGFSGSGLLARQSESKESDAPKTSSETPAAAALTSGLKQLEKGQLDAAKRAYMYLFVHDRTASHVLMKAMKAWVEKRARPAGVDATTADAFAAWVRERDTLASSVGNLGHNSPDWK